MTIHTPKSMLKRHLMVHRPDLSELRVSRLGRPTACVLVPLVMLLASAVAASSADLGFIPAFTRVDLAPAAITPLTVYLHAASTTTIARRPKRLPLPEHNDDATAHAGIGRSRRSR